MALTIYSPELWDRTREQRTELHDLTFDDVVAVLDAHCGAYVAVEAGVEHSMSGIEGVAARGQLCRDRTLDDPDDSDDPPLPLTLYHDLVWGGRRVGRFTVEELAFVNATLYGDSAKDCAGLLIVQDIWRLDETGELPPHRLQIAVWFDRVTTGPVS